MPNPAANAKQAVLLRNTYSAAATEWVTSAGGGVRHRWGLPATRGAAPIPPGGSRAISAPSADSVQTLAVIYADGATAGDPLMIKDMLQARQAMLDDLRQVVPMLTSAAANPDENYTALEATFNSRLAQQRQALQSAYLDMGGQGGAPAASDRVCDVLAMDIAQSLNKGLSQKAMARRYAVLAKYFAGWEQQLQAGQPALR